MEHLKQYETERLILRPTGIEDAEFLVELMNTPKWLINIGDRNVKTVEDAKAYVEAKIVPQQQRLGFSNFTLIRKEDQTKLGTCGLYDREGLPGLDIGFALLPQHEGKGYGFESANKMQEVAFEEYGYPELGGITIEENTASRKLLEKLGLTFKNYINLPEDEVELMYYWMENPSKQNQI